MRPCGGSNTPEMGKLPQKPSLNVLVITSLFAYSDLFS